MTLQIRISNLNKKRPINRNAVKKAAFFVLRRFKKSEVSIDITFVSNRRIKRLNEKYREVNAPTDVLSFLLEEGTFLKNAGLIIGDIYISSDMAYDNARRFKTGLPGEVLLYVIHGVLHLLGFRDETLEEKRKIGRLENRLLGELWSGKGLSKA